MTEIKTYSSKSNAARAFRTKFPQAADGMTNAQLAEAGYVDEDQPGKWVINDPATLAGQEADDFDPAITALAELSQDEFEAGMAEELAQREAIRQRREGFITVETASGSTEVDLSKMNIDPSQHPGGLKELPADFLAPGTGKSLQVSPLSLPKSGLDGKCPHCGKSTRNGERATEFQEMSPGSQATTDHQFTCNDCAGEWGPKVEKVRKSRAPKVRSSLVSPVKFMWDMLDAEPGLARKEAVRRGIEAGVSPNTAATQFQWWRKARGLVAPK